MSVLCEVCGSHMEMVEFCLQCCPPQEDSPMPPTEPPRTDDSGALVQAVRTEHYPKYYVGNPARCVFCAEAWPCLTARLAAALAQVQSELATRRSQDEGNQRDAGLAVKWLQERDTARADAAALRSLLIEIAGDYHYCKHSIAADELLGTYHGAALTPPSEPARE